MSRRTFLLRRTVFAAVALLAVLTATFAVIELTANPAVARVAAEASRQAAAENANATEQTRQVREAVRAYREANGLDRPLPVRYVDWMVSVVTLDWGVSRDPARLGQRSVRTIVGDGLATTAVWVTPAVVGSLVGSTVFGLATASRTTSGRERSVAGVSYLLYGLPNFWLALIALPVVVTTAVPTAWLAASGVGVGTVAASLALGLSLLAVQARYVRTEANERLRRAFVKTVRAKGGGRRAVGRHVLRHGAVTLASLFVADVLGVLVVEVFVLETALGLDGFGALGVQAIQRQDLPIVLGVTFVLAAVGVTANLLADVVYGTLDPRATVDD